jgi:SAM-dependent methyltransferase
MTVMVSHPAGTLDWSLGHYELAASLSVPFARSVLDRVGVNPGDRVLDLGCATGNAALIAAELGAHATGVDPALRLLDLARDEADARELDATFLAGHAADIPLDDRSVDVVISLSGVTYAPDPVAAAAEMARVTAPGGRLVLTSWSPDGVIQGTRCMLAGAVRRVLGQPATRRGSVWNDPAAITELLGTHGFDVTIEHLQHPITAPSLEEYFEAEFLEHPHGAVGRPVLDSVGEGDHMLDRVRAALFYANEHPTRFRITSPYILITAQRR